MNEPDENDAERTKVHLTEGLPWNVFAEHARGWQNAQAQDLSKELAYTYGMVLTELRVTRKADCWLTMVKARKNNVDYVAYSASDYFEEALEYAFFEIRNGLLSFRGDRYPPKR